MPTPSPSRKCMAVLIGLVLTGPIGAFTSSAQSVLSPDKAGRAQNTAVGFSRKAVICDWLAHNRPDEAGFYAEWAGLCRAIADQQWQIWQAHHFDDADLLQQAAAAMREFTRRDGEYEKTRRTRNLPKPDVAVFKTAGTQTDAGRAAAFERTAIENERLAYTHSYRSENRREDYHRFNLAMAQAFSNLALQNWRAWCAVHLDDQAALNAAQAQIRVLRAEINDYRRQRHQYEDVRRVDPAKIDQHETIALNHGMIGVKCHQMAIQVDKPLKDVYLDLSANYRQSTQLHRDRAAAARAQNERAVAALDVRLANLRAERQQLWEREREGIQSMRNDASTADQRRAIAQFKKEYRQLRAQVAQIAGAD